MQILKFDQKIKGTTFKPLNATNGGPCHRRHANTQYRSNFETYKEARMPYSRNHDSALLSIYGGPFSHDITRIFPNFDADVNDPASYDFACTDESVLVTLDAGTKTFFRLGQSIEHQIKKHDTLPPKDFKKWAEICEHIIMHYNEGWADGFKLDFDYWEIWNEPDLVADDHPNKKTWGGTKAQFFDLYEIAAKHLKERFPNLKIGGPALAWNEEWADDFLKEMKKRNVPIDFFSWHVYNPYPRRIMIKGERIRKMLDDNGFQGSESILNEWNYLEGWREEYVRSIETIHSMKGAAFVMACMSAGQRSTIDMLMYYDTRPSIFNGAFDYYTLRPLKAYYSLKWYGMFYDMCNELRCEETDEDIYTLCGTDKDNKLLCTVTYYTNFENEAEAKEITLDFKKEGEYEIYLLDETHDSQLIKTTKETNFTMQPNSCIMIKEI